MNEEKALGMIKTKNIKVVDWKAINEEGMNTNISIRFRKVVNSLVKNI